MDQEQEQDYPMPGEGNQLLSRLGVLDERTGNIANAMSNLVTKVEQLYDLTKTVAQMQERQAQHSDALDRAFTAIDKMDGRLTQAVTDGNKAIDEGRRERQAVRSDLDKWINRAIGGWLVGVLLIGVIQWFVLRQINVYEDSVHRLLDAQAAQEKRLTQDEFETSRTNTALQEHFKREIEVHDELRREMKGR